MYELVLEVSVCDSKSGLIPEFLLNLVLIQYKAPESSARMALPELLDSEILEFHITQVQHSRSRPVPVRIPTL